MSNLWNNVIAGLFIMFLFGLGILGCSDSNSNDLSLNTPGSIDGGIDQFNHDLKIIASQPRNSGSERHNAVQMMCIDRFEILGFQVALQAYGSGTNVIGAMLGDQYPEERVVVSAHYDSLSECNSADDNASGVAGLFETARILSSETHDRTLVVACFDEEELGMIGSRAYAAWEKENRSDIIISYVYDMIGYINDAPNSQQIPDNFDLLFPQKIQQMEDNQYRGNFIIVLGDSEAMALMNRIDEFALTEELPLVKLDMGSGMSTLAMMPDALRADHAAFWEQGYPAVLINDTAEFRNPAYHCRSGPDDIDTLDPEFAMKVIRTTVEQIRESLKRNP